MQARFLGLQVMVSSDRDVAEWMDQAQVSLSRTRGKGDFWDMSHLAPFTFTVDPKLGFELSVLVLFSCHCFTHSFRWDERASHLIPDSEIHDDGRERRVLDQRRYQLSKRYLRGIVTSLMTRRLYVADSARSSFVTYENIADDAGTTYAVFFSVKRDPERKRRVLLRIQSAYELVGTLSARMRNACKVGFATVLRAAYTGRRIKS